MKTKIVRFILFLIPVLLIAIYPILFFYANNISELSLLFLKTPLTLSIVISTILALIIDRLVKNHNKSALITCLLVFVFYTYGHLSRYLTNILFIPLPGGVVIGPDKLLLPSIFLLVLLIIYKILRTKNNLTQAIFFINIVLFLLCTNLLIMIIKFEFYKTKDKSNIVNIKSNQKVDITKSPDVYHIILDGYARNDILKDIYDYDNSSFITELEKMGFFVAKKARSNYMHTYLSLPSTFNMIYLDSLVERYGKNPIDDTVAKSMMSNNLVLQKFKTMNYKTYNFVSDWAGTNENYQADVTIGDGKTFQFLGLKIIASESNMVFLQTTLLSPFIQEVLENALRSKTLSAFKKMPDIPYLAGSKYVLAHIMSPHPPYVFTEDGGEVHNPNLNNADEGVNRRPYYLAQLKFISNQTLPLLKKLIKNSPKPPVIILQSDHGPGSIFGTRNKWKSNYSQSAVAERSGILYAVLLPDKNYQQFTDNMTPINTYSILFNQYFGENNELLPNKTYYTSYDEIYGFYDVTGD